MKQREFPLRLPCEDACLRRASSTTCSNSNGVAASPCSTANPISRLSSRRPNKISKIGRPLCEAAGWSIRRRAMVERPSAGLPRSNGFQPPCRPRSFHVLSNSSAASRERFSCRTGAGTSMLRTSVSRFPCLRTSKRSLLANRRMCCSRPDCPICIESLLWRPADLISWRGRFLAPGGRETHLFAGKFPSCCHGDWVCA